jgi:hypothetical protein
VDHDRPIELPPRRGCRYVAFTDPAGGGANADSYTLSIVHREGERRIVDLIRGTKGKYDPQFVTAEYAILLREYGVHRVVGDRYAAEWVVAAWRAAGITYEQSELSKSEIFLAVEPLFVRGLVSMPDVPVLLREARLLEKSAARSGKQEVGHPRGYHDDHINAVAGAIRLASAPEGICALLARNPEIMSGSNVANPVQHGPTGELGERALLQMQQRGGGFGAPVSWGDLGSMGRCRR